MPSSAPRPSERAEAGPEIPKRSDQHMLDALPYPVFTIDESFSFLWLNHQAESFFKSSRAMLAKSSLESLMPSDSPLFDLVRRSFMTGRSVSDRSVSLVSPKFGVKIADVHLAPLQEGAEVGAVLISIHEQTALRQFEEMHQFKGAALSMSKMTSVLCHEIKNPLAGIKGAAQLLEADLSEEGYELSQMIVSEADRITALLSRIETFSTDAPLRQDLLNIHEVLDHSVRVTQASFGRHLRISCQYDPSLPLVEADNDLLVQCFINLLKNASEATSDGDRLDISTSYNLSRYISQGAVGQRVHLPLQIEIRDTGGGIPEEVRAHIFEPFVSSKSEGSGLGLAMVASIISDHGGTIALKDVGKGSCFVINLPLPAKAQKQQIPAIGSGLS